MSLNSIFAKGVPEELNDILPGQITIFVPISGVNLTSLRIAQTILQLSGKLDVPQPILQITPTTYEPLCGCLVGRKQNGDKCTFLVGDKDCLATFLAEFWNINIRTLTETKGLFPIIFKGGSSTPISHAIAKPAVPENPMMHELTNKIPTLSEARIKLEEAISICVNHGYDIDIDELKKKIKEENLNSNKYELKLELTPTKANNVKCDVCISVNGKVTPLELTAINKSVYLAFLLYKDGLVLNDIKMDFVRKVESLYKKMPDKVQDDKNGILGGNFKLDTMAGYRSEIRDAIKEIIKNSKIVDRFAIEGYRGKPYMIMAGTDEIREQIKEAYGLN